MPLFWGRNDKVMKNMSLKDVDITHLEFLSGMYLENVLLEIHQTAGSI